MHEGRWVNASGGQSRDWQVPRCIFHDYGSPPELSACLATRETIFLGDSITREVFLAMARKLDKNAERKINLTDKHQDLEFNATGVSLRFVWDPFMNSTFLRQLLESFLPQHESHHVIRPGILFVGGGLWHARYSQGPPLPAYKKSIDMVSSSRSNISLNGKSIDPWFSGFRNLNQDLLLLSPVEVPSYRRLSEDRYSTMTPDRIDSLNEYLRHISTENGTNVLWSYSLLSLEDTDVESDGLHRVPEISNVKAEILLNLRCNGLLSARGYTSFRGTCCSNYYTPILLERFLLVVAGLLFPLTAIFLARNQCSTSIRSASIFTSAVAFCFLTDRTQIFDKVSKRFVSTEFMLMICIVFVLGFVSIRSSRVPSQAPDGALSAKDGQSFLSRDQTDEWKGWMQFVILIYHYTGASKVLWIYKIVRFLVSSYLFMTGFGHTCYYLKTGADFSMRRFTSVLLRTNLLAISLAYMMRTDYLSYYFAPLSSFWFVVVFLTMHTGHRYSTSSTFLVAKIFVSAMMTSYLVLGSGIMEPIFAALQHTCNIHWDLKEWRFRLSLDMLIIYVGMLVGVAYRRINFDLSKRNQLASITISVLVILVFYHFTSSIPDKYAYNAWHPYISPFPVLAYVALRNSTPRVRSSHSSIFVWLGRCSLETFTLQYHIWLAADARGLLSTGLFSTRHGDSRIIDLLMLTPVFLWISHHVAIATGVITMWLMDPQTSLARQDDTLIVSREKETQNFVETSRMRDLVRKLRGVLKEDLRVRLGIVLVLMWMCNWIYVVL